MDSMGPTPPSVSGDYVGYEWVYLRRNFLGRITHSVNNPINTPAAAIASICSSRQIIYGFYFNPLVLHTLFQLFNFMLHSPPNLPVAFSLTTCPSHRLGAYPETSKQAPGGPSTSSGRTGIFPSW